MKLIALGLTIMARIQGSLRRSAGFRGVLDATAFGAWTPAAPGAGVLATEGLLALRLTATVVSAGGRLASLPMGEGAARGVSSTAGAKARPPALATTCLPSDGHGVRLAVVSGAAAATWCRCRLRTGVIGAVAFIDTSGVGWVVRCAGHISRRPRNRRHGVPEPALAEQAGRPRRPQLDRIRFGRGKLERGRSRCRCGLGGGSARP